MSILTVVVSTSIPAKFTLLDEVFESEPLLNVTGGTILSSGESELTTAIGLTYSACPNGAAVIGNEPSSTHSTYMNEE